MIDALLTGRLAADTDLAGFDGGDQFGGALVFDLGGGLHRAARDVQHFRRTILRDRCANLRSMICALAITQVRQLRRHLGPLRGLEGER